MENIQCLDCGNKHIESDLINKTCKNSKDEILHCPDCDSKNLKEI